MKNSKEELKNKAAAGALWLVSKRIVAQAVYTFSNIVLARLLFPEDFGTFAIIGFVGVLISVFSDLGLGPSLIQKKDKIDNGYLQTVFTFQFILSLLIFLTINLIAPLVSNYYGLGDKGSLLFRLYSIYFLLGPFKTTSGAILERNLEYRKLVAVELAEIFSASTATVILAFLGFGVFSLVIGGVLGHMVGAACYFKFSPWPVKFKLEFLKLHSLAKFGLHVQINSLVGVFYGPLILLYLGKKIGAGNLGFYQFAASISVMPLAFSEIVNRIIFPLGARVQKKEAYFRGIVERAVVVVSATTLPIAFIGIAVAPFIVHHLYTDRWLASLPAIYLGLAQMVFISYSGVFSALLLSRGQSKVVRDMSIIWAITTWVLAPVLINKFNFVGMSLTSFLVSLTGLFLLYKLKKQTNFSFLSSTAPFFISSLISGVLAYVLIRVLPGTFVNFLIVVALAVFCFVVLVLLVARKLVIESVGLLTWFFYRFKKNI